ncbi:MAG: transglutaminase [Arcobacter sp.]|uniref:transglutaminase-like cysteine peptidase n=1 Tax=uncultured Arcobacter sp. TaxID=165434 RepID=UPI000CBDD3CA|nr:transglutaminase-like cysteine peptidase [uncultured Arcobacter sp.]PLY09321.1 MAG: transglutaminase [Arcobacter sp.]
MRKYLIICSLFITLLTFSFAVKTFNISQEKLNQFTKKYGEVAETRVLIWDKMVEDAKTKDILHKLKDVNDFFNKIKYQTDQRHWNKKDYWAAPFEFMGTGAGDCEDYAIAKYFTLRQLGVPENKLRITYVKLLQRGTKYEQAHMVLTYYHKPGATPVVLDNVNKTLKLASKRPDLKPVYSFNAQGLWQAKNKGKTSELVGKNNLRSWKDLMNRI